MPQLTGIELVRRARAANVSTPVVLMTGYARQAHTQELRQLDVRRLLLKPFSLKTIRRLVAETLDEN